MKILNYGLLLFLKTKLLKMRVLWLSNVLFPDVCNELQIQPPVVGGWMASGANALLCKSNIELAVVALYSGAKLIHIDKYSIKYYLIPSRTRNIEKYFYEIQAEFKPEIVHIHGTEYSHSLAYINACGAKNVVVSIQGLVSKYEKYYYGGIEKANIRISLRDILRLDFLSQQHNNMKLRGKNEVKILQKVEHIIGRTSWDRSNIWAINPLAKYHFCNETLRDSFYRLKWESNNFEPYTIFISQAHYPLKGLHQVIKSVSIVQQHYPDVKVFVAGENAFTKPSWKRSGYSNYIMRLMEKHNLKDKFIFLGSLSEYEMALQFKKANVFVCPSIIENSPNSIGEAQLIGTPCIASYVGGTVDMINEGETGFLYRFEEIELLAFRVCQLFSDKELCKLFSENGRKTALLRHSKDDNALKLINIYENIVTI